MYLGALLLAFIASDAVSRRRLAALALLCVAIYALVAMGRSNVFMRLNIEPSESARQARYHYVAAIPLAMLFILMVARLARGTRGRAIIPAVALATWIGITSLAYFTSGFRIDQRPAVRRYVSASQQAIAAKIEAAAPGQPVTFENVPLPEYVLGAFQDATVFPGLAGVFVLTYPSNVVGGRPVRFLERNAEVLAAWRDPATNHRLASLLIPPDGAALTTGH